jgi:hypothetical protein
VAFKVSSHPDGRGAVFLTMFSSSWFVTIWFLTNSLCKSIIDWIYSLISSPDNFVDCKTKFCKYFVAYDKTENKHITLHEWDPTRVNSLHIHISTISKEMQDLHYLLKFKSATELEQSFYKSSLLFFNSWSLRPNTSFQIWSEFQYYCIPKYCKTKIVLLLYE